MVGAQPNFPVQLSALEADPCYAQRGRRKVLCSAEPRYQLFGSLLSRHNLFIIYLLFSQCFIFFFPVTSPDISHLWFYLILHGFVLLSAFPSREPSFTRNHHFVLLVLPGLGLGGLGLFAGLPNPKDLQAKDMYIYWWIPYHC